MKKSSWALHPSSTLTDELLVPESCPHAVLRIFMRKIIYM